MERWLAVVGRCGRRETPPPGREAAKLQESSLDRDEK
jgi:hypothetical protein